MMNGDGDTKFSNISLRRLDIQHNDIQNNDT